MRVVLAAGFGAVARDGAGQGLLRDVARWWVAIRPGGVRRPYWELKINAVKIQCTVGVDHFGCGGVDNRRMTAPQISLAIGTMAAGATLIFVWIRTRRHQERIAILALVAGLLATAAAIAQVAVAVFPVKTSPEPSPSSSLEVAATCKGTVSSGLARANPKKVGNLAFCPTRINDGKVPIAGPFSLKGQVIGPPAERSNLLLMVKLDRATCTTEGNPPAPGRFLLKQPIDFGADANGLWSYFDDLGNHPPSLTLGRIFEFATAPKDVVEDLYDRREEWQEEGITNLPLQITILSSFKVAPGKVKGAIPCGK